MPWDGAFDALKEPPPCAGRNNYIKQHVGTDDCLYLNIYTKDLKPSKPCAVIVYIFGGGEGREGVVKSQEEIEKCFFKVSIRAALVLMFIHPIISSRMTS